MNGLIIAAMSALSITAANIDLPPSRFDYEPRVPYTVTEVPANFIAALCGPESIGCAWPGDHIYIIEGLRPSIKARLLRHEKAHVNGWKH